MSEHRQTENEAVLDFITLHNSPTPCPDPCCDICGAWDTLTTEDCEQGLVWILDSITETIQ